MLQTGALNLQLRLFFLAQIGALDLGQLVQQHVLQARRFAFFGDESAMRLANRAELADEPGDLGSLGEHGGVAIEVVDLLAGAEECHVLGLAVDVDQ